METSQPGSTVTHLDLAYAGASAAQKLDLYLPSEGQNSVLVIYIHGGAFRFGDKAEARLVEGFGPLLERGYAVASLNYRLSGEAIFPAQAEDVKAAVRWLRQHAGDYGFDPARFGCWGASAGGHLAALLGTSGDGGPGQSAPETVSCRVQAVVSWFAPIDFLQMDKQLALVPCEPSWLTHDLPDSPESLLIGGPIQQNQAIVRQTNPITFVSADAPPFLLQHGSADCVVPPLQSQLLYDALLPVVGADKVSLDYLPGAKHADRAFNAPDNMTKVLDFLDRHLLIEPGTSFGT